MQCKAETKFKLLLQVALPLAISTKIQTLGHLYLELIKINLGILNFLKVCGFFFLVFLVKLIHIGQHQTRNG